MLEHPHAVLLAAVAVVLALEGFRGARTIGTAPVWPVSQALVGAVALGFVWRRQELLRLRSLLAVALVFEIGWIVLHLALGVHSDFESAHVYPREGNALLHGNYPDTEYPPGAILLFALDALVSGGSGEGVRVAHAFVMVPFQLATVAGVWALRTRWSGWFAALVAVWPLNAFFWEFKFDPAPTAALVLGLVLALRERWLTAGIAFGLGAALKWTPGIAAAALVFWLLCSRRGRDAWRHALGSVGAFLLVNVPFLAVWPGLVLHTYNVQGSRGISGESFLYLPLRLVGDAELRPGGEIWSDAVVPGWARTAAVLFQVLSVLVVFAAAARVRTRLRAGVAVAAMAPVAFLLTNRTFSPQYLVTIFAAWAVAGALLVRSKPEQAALALPMLGATLANVLVYPTVTPTYWWVCSGVLFLLAFVATLWVLFRAVTAINLPLVLAEPRFRNPLLGSGEPGVDHQVAQLVSIQEAEVPDPDEHGRVAVPVRRREERATVVGQQQLLDGEIVDAEHQHVVQPLARVRVESIGSTAPVKTERLPVHGIRRPAILGYLPRHLRHRQRQLVEIDHPRHGRTLPRLGFPRSGSAKIQP